MGGSTVQTESGNRAELNSNDGRLNVNNNFGDDANDNVWFGGASRHFLLSFLKVAYPLHTTNYQM